MDGGPHTHAHAHTRSATMNRGSDWRKLQEQQIGLVALDIAEAAREYGLALAFAGNSRKKPPNHAMSTKFRKDKLEALHEILLSTCERISAENGFPISVPRHPLRTIEVLLAERRLVDQALGIVSLGEGDTSAHGEP